MAHRVCPWWLGYWLASPMRRWSQDPAQILLPWVREGMTILEPGPGMGFFTLELARRVGPSGRVIAVDIQSRMLDSLRRRAAKAGLLDRIETRLTSAGSMNVANLRGRVDFTLLYAMVHEVPDVAHFFSEVAAVSKPGATVLLAEPTGHVKQPDFDAELQAAAAAGLAIATRPAIPRSFGALLHRTAVS